MRWIFRPFCVRCPHYFSLCKRNLALCMTYDGKCSRWLSCCRFWTQIWESISLMSTQPLSMWTAITSSNATLLWFGRGTKLGVKCQLSNEPGRQPLQVCFVNAADGIRIALNSKIQSNRGRRAKDEFTSQQQIELNLRSCSVMCCTVLEHHSSVKVNRAPIPSLPWPPLLLDNKRRVASQTFESRNEPDRP